MVTERYTIVWGLTNNFFYQEKAVYSDVTYGNYVKVMISVLECLNFPRNMYCYKIQVKGYTCWVLGGHGRYIPFPAVETKKAIPVESLFSIAEKVLSYLLALGKVPSQQCQNPP